MALYSTYTLETKEIDIMSVLFFILLIDVKLLLYFGTKGSLPLISLNIVSFYKNL